MFNIFIDPGHGGDDPGAVSRGLREKDLTLKVALKIKQILEKRYKGLMVKLSRESDETIPLKERTEMANKWPADYLISIHFNAGGGTGFESFTYNKEYANKSKTNDFRDIVHDEIVKETGFKNRGKKEANLHMLRESAMSAVLTENGFIDHKHDVIKLMNDFFLDKIARGHAVGIANVLGLKRRESVKADHIYIVNKGDTLWGIAKKERMSLDDLLQLNPNVKARELQIGQKILLK